MAKKNPEPPSTKQLSAKFQIIVIIVTTLAISVALQKRILDFRIRSDAPEILTMTPKNLKQFGQSPGVIQTGLIINELQKVDVVRNNFIFTGIIWFEFEPGIIALETLEKFKFEKGKILFLSSPETKLTGNKILVRYNIRVQFSSELNYADFPLDDHRIYLMFSLKRVTPDEIVFKSSDSQFLINVDTKAIGWDLLDKGVTAGYREIQLDPDDDKKIIYYPAVLYSMDFTRYGTRYIISIFVPLLFIFYLSLFSISIGAANGFRLVTTAITAILAYRFVIGRLAPTTGYFMISDYIFFLFLAMTFAVFLFNVTDMATDKVQIYHKKILLVVINAIVFFVCIYLFLFL